MTKRTTRQGERATLASSTMRKSPHLPKKVAPTRSALALRMEVERARLGWSHTELARQSGMPISTVHLIESGARPNPSYVVVGAIARAFGISFEELTGLASAPGTATGLEPPWVGELRTELRALQKSTTEHQLSLSAQMRGLAEALRQSLGLSEGQPLPEAAQDGHARQPKKAPGSPTRARNQ